MSKGEFVPVSLQRWVLPYMEEDGTITILESPPGTDFQWEESKYGLLPDASQIEEWINSEWEIKKLITELDNSKLGDINEKNKAQ